MIALIARVLVSGVLLTAAGLKLFGAGATPEPTLYAAFVRQLPAGLSLALPALEIALAVLLWMPMVNRPARVATTLMLCCFAGMLVVESGKPAPRRCGCLGSGGAAWVSPRVQNLGVAGLDLLLAAGLNAGRIRGAGASRSGARENRDGNVRLFLLFCVGGGVSCSYAKCLCDWGYGIAVWGGDWVCPIGG
jgi:hypothetical protein